MTTNTTTTSRRFDFDALRDEVLATLEEVAYYESRSDSDGATWALDELLTWIEHNGWHEDSVLLLGADGRKVWRRIRYYLH